MYRVHTLLSLVITLITLMAPPPPFVPSLLCRNNHVNALFKYEDAVYLLVTDQGYEYEPDIVCEASRPVTHL